MRGMHTEIDVGGVDERAENDTDNDSSSSQRVSLLLDALGGRKAGEEISDLIILTVGLRLEVHVDMRLLLIVARLERIRRDAVRDDGFGDHDGQSLLKI